MAGTIGGITGAGKTRSAEGTLGDTSLFVATEDDPQTFQFENVVRSFATHGLDGILIAEIEPALRGVEGMGFPGIVRSQCRVDAPLRSHRVAPDRMDLG